MITIRDIGSHSCELVNPSGVVAGTITNGTQLTDVRSQICLQKAEGWSFRWDGRTLPINSYGNLEDWPVGFFDTEADALCSLLGVQVGRRKQERKAALRRSNA